MSRALLDSLLGLAGAICVLAGIVACARAVFILIKHAQNPVDYSVASAAGSFVVGLLFVSATQFWATISGTLTVKTTGIAYSTGASAQTLAQRLGELDSLAVAIGVGFFIRALFMLRDAETQAAVWRALFTIFASVIIANPGWLIAVLT
jgi:hypothetical protein